MNTKKKAVYDSKSYFSRFLKYEFRKTLKFDTFKNFNFFEEVIHNYSTILFVIYEEDELVDFMKIHKKGIPLIVCTFNEQLLIKFQNTDEILVLNTSKLKSDVIRDLKTYFDLLYFYSTV